jgi:hypothetical protein
MYTRLTYAEFFHMWELHIQRSKLQHCFEYYFEPIKSESIVVISVGFFREAAET